ncbi:hypothetical protein PIROE2DRAFT_17555 [Piromyces sp. E2]|nr:hypothetical protein PIROE2DRAFT_17555 [Piromyces sp. E2]|eukprot:OUM57461.1 hypothetical protein PIROE2DRAFT_17555 [Piromyces sp. E2]
MHFAEVMTNKSILNDDICIYTSGWKEWFCNNNAYENLFMKLTGEYSNVSSARRIIFLDQYQDFWDLSICGNFIQFEYTKYQN